MRLCGWGLHHIAGVQDLTQPALCEPTSIILTILHLCTYAKCFWTVFKCFLIILMITKCFVCCKCKVKSQMSHILYFWVSCLPGCYGGKNYGIKFTFWWCISPKTTPKLPNGLCIINVSRVLLPPEGTYWASMDFASFHLELLDVPGVRGIGFS